MTVQELSMKELFEVRDAVTILEKHGIYVDQELRESIRINIGILRDGGDR